MLELIHQVRLGGRQGRQIRITAVLARRLDALGQVWGERLGTGAKARGSVATALLLQGTEMSLTDETSSAIRAELDVLSAEALDNAFRLEPGNAA